MERDADVSANVIPGKRYPRVLFASDFQVPTRQQRMIDVGVAEHAPYVVALAYRPQELDQGGNLFVRKRLSAVSGVYQFDSYGILIVPDRVVGNFVLRDTGGNFSIAPDYVMDAEDRIFFKILPIALDGPGWREDNSSIVA
jgi:hypothetical protein